jgi:hypothetical protein
LRNDCQASGIQLGHSWTAMPRFTYADRATRFDAVIKAAKARSDADQVLSAMLAGLAHDRREKIQIVAALRELKGPVGSAAIRDVFARAVAELAIARPSQRSWLTDLAYAALYALRERDGPAATDVFVTAAFHTSRILSNFGMSTLTSVGDGRAWEDVLTILGEILRTKAGKGTQRGAQVLVAIEYLASYAEPGTDKAIRLVTLVRDQWRNIGDRAWADARWPGIGPGGPPPDAVIVN